MLSLTGGSDDPVRPVWWPCCKVLSDALTSGGIRDPFQHSIGTSLVHPHRQERLEHAATGVVLVRVQRDVQSPSAGTVDQGQRAGNVTDSAACALEVRKVGRQASPF